MEQRVVHFKIFLVVVVLIIIAKLFYMQVIDTKYKALSLINSIRKEVLYPFRGDIVDRNNLLLAQSKEAYDICVTPRDLKVFDTLALCMALEMSIEKFDSTLTVCKKYSRRKESIIKSGISQISKLQIEELNIPGVSIVYRSVRSYPYDIGGNILGYTGSVSPYQIEQNPYYDIHDDIGKIGLEKTFETILRGTKGQLLKIVNVHGAVVADYKDGEENSNSIAGKKLTTTIDIELQKFGEELMKGKVGAIVAIEPATGEILAMISSPTYNPDMLIGNDRTANYKILTSDKRRPLYNRATDAAYPPGSIYKIAVALALLQEDIITAKTRYTCRGKKGYYSRLISVGCHHHYSPASLGFAISTSCNSYFCNGLVDMLESKKYGGAANGLDRLASIIKEFGFGSKLGADVNSESEGYVPSSELYNRVYGKGRWRAHTIISTSIGQGEVLTTPLQLANFGAIVANRGFHYTPHFFKHSESGTLKEEFTIRKTTSIDKEYYETVIDAMWDSVNKKEKGLRIDVKGLDICGKSGTAQNGFGEDHSTYLAIAPRDTPKIVINVYVENGGFGASVAAPIASLMIEKYLTREVKRDWLLNYVLDKEIEYPHYDKK